MFLNSRRTQPPPLARKLSTRTITLPGKEHGTCSTTAITCTRCVSVLLSEETGATVASHHHE